MNDKDILKELGIEQEVNSNSGFVDPRKYGMVWFSNNQLKRVAEMLAKSAATKTKQEIDEELINSGIK